MDLNIDKISSYEIRKKVNTINGGQSMKLYKKLISDNLKCFLIILCNNAGIMQMKLKLSHLK